MSDYYGHITIVLEKDLKDDDAKDTLTALRQIKGVLSAEPNIRVGSDHVAEVRAKTALRQRLWDALNDE